MNQFSFIDMLFRDAQTRRRVFALYAALVTSNLIAWAWAFAMFSNQPVLMGTAFLAYALGLRHAFDVDHIAAIDNVVRKLMQKGKKPLGVGFFFSLGHSSIVVIASAIIAASAAALQTQLREFQEAGGIVGTLVSAFFLLTIGIANLIVLRGIWGAFERAKCGDEIVDADLDEMLSGRGFFARIFKRVFGTVRSSWHMYPIGFLFGLGFDTATEIGLLGISATQASSGMNFWSIMIFSALFTAGMALVDTTDSVAMVGAYGWSFVNPIRKLWYNMTITAASAVVAIFVGVVEVGGLLSDRLALSGGPWEVIRDLNGNLANFGYSVVGLFLLSWLVSTLIYRARRYDEIGGA